MKGFNYLGVLSITLIVIFSCSPEIEYKKISVAQEGGIRFTRITDKEDAVVAPQIDTSQGRLYVRIRNTFDVSKDETKIAFIANKNNRQDIFIKYLTGSKSLLQRTFTGNIWDVSFSPDREWLVYSAWKYDNYEIFLIKAEAGSAVQQITFTKYNEYNPVFFPTKKAILYNQAEIQIEISQQAFKYSSNLYLWSYDMEKSSFIQYVMGESPSFLPDGNRVVVTRNNKETNLPELWLIDLQKGQEFIIVTSKEKGYIQPAVSPDGEKIAFVTQTEAEDIPSNLDIYLISINGTNLIQLTFHPGHDLLPKWSPDSKSIYFLSQRGSEKGEWNIWRMDLQF